MGVSDRAKHIEIPGSHYSGSAAFVRPGMTSVDRGSRYAGFAGDARPQANQLVCRGMTSLGGTLSPAAVGWAMSVAR
ncbi:hypothetical protein SAMN05216367_3416 [Tardiphaga sp. OK245]|nr:hypothetical protein SAMN05216367_3416 [Tardiphaga sp. OK245]